MLIYSASKSTFLDDISQNNIEDILRNRFKIILNRKVGNNEYNSWKNSLREMYFVIDNSTIPDDSNICIEFNIPGSGKRIDIIVSGLDKDKTETIIIIELKQWQEAELSDKDGLVITRFMHGLSETSHPSYQAWSYAMLLKGFNSVVYEQNIQLWPCAFLHNYQDNGVINNSFYSYYLDKAPVFLKGEKNKLSDFISNNIKYGDRNQLMSRIENGKMRPSKVLADSLSSMLKGNKEFIMIDDQKIVYETALSLAKKSSDLNKNVLIVEGGPGTGKSVVAINLLVELTKLSLLTQYVTKNSAPRTVYHSKLTGTLRGSEISSIFKGSGSFINCEQNEFDALIVDEAHRLNAKSGMFSNLGENQIKEIINASKFSVFFIDEDQKVTMKDIGEKEEIIKRAQDIGANIHNLELVSQFRCNGSDGYLAWLDNVLQIKKTANVYLDKSDFDFKVYDDPSDLIDIIFQKNEINNKARIVAGYCWDWVSKKDKSAYDIEFPEYNFAMKWNLASDGMLWILASESVNEIGCIHTCQGLEVDYIGVIIGNDLVVRDGEVIANPDNRAKTDSSLKGYKSKMKEYPEETKEKVTSLIKNTYRTLLTRGMKGCYIYCTDNETSEYFKQYLQ